MNTRIYQTFHSFQKNKSLSSSSSSSSLNSSAFISSTRARTRTLVVFLILNQTTTFTSAFPVFSSSSTISASALSPSASASASVSPLSASSVVTRTLTTFPKSLSFRMKSCSSSSSLYTSTSPSPSPSPTPTPPQLHATPSLLPNITNLQQLIQTNISDNNNNNNNTNNDNNDNDSPNHNILQRTIPTLSSKSHKGSSGRLSILGGSAKYTGAPYYAAMSALRFGCDLVTVHCANEASIPLKSYSPELMVECVYSATEFDELSSSLLSSSSSPLSPSSSSPSSSLIQNNDNNEQTNKTIITEKINDMVSKVTSNFNRIHTIIIGPGLGRCPLVLKATSIIIQKALVMNLNIVLDADGLFLLTDPDNYDIFMNCYGGGDSNGDSNSDSNGDSNGDSDGDDKSTSKVVLTPNVIEYKRLVESIGGGSEEVLKSKLPGVTIIRKGYEDVIEYIDPMNTLEPMSTSTSTSNDDDKHEHEHTSTSSSSSSSSSSSTNKLIMTCNEKGGLKRSGGIGDVLAGSVGTFLAWNQILENENRNKCNIILNQNNNQGSGANIANKASAIISSTNAYVGDQDLVLACWMACCLTKRSTARAFEKRKRSMTAPDILEEIGDVVDEIASSTIQV